MGTPELKQKLEAARNTFDYRLEKVLFEVAEQVCKLIESQRITRSELAQRLSVSPAYITKLLNGNPNLTIKSLLRLSDVLGQTIDIRFAPNLGVLQSTSTTIPIDAPSTLPVREYTATRTPNLAEERPLEVTNDLALAA